MKKQNGYTVLFAEIRPVTELEKIIEEQKIDVDAVSGATNSSTVIKKAVENALKGGL